MEGWYKLHKFFCPCWAGGGRTLICLSTIQLVEPFAGFLVWAVIFLVVLNLIFYCADFAGLFFHMPSFSISESRPASFCLCVAFFSFASLFVVKNYIRCFCTKHVRPGSLKFPSAIAESFSVLCTKCTSLESRIIHRQTSTFNETYMKSWLIAASAFLSWRKWSFL